MADFGRFMIDRLMSIMISLSQEAEVKVDVHPRRTSAPMGLNPYAIGQTREDRDG